MSLSDPLVTTRVETVDVQYVITSPRTPIDTASDAPARRRGFHWQNSLRLFYR